jgi:hypothetical protein
MSLPLNNAVESKVFASTLAAAVVGLLKDLLVLLVAFNVNISEEQRAAILGFTTTVTVLAVAAAGYWAKHTSRVDLADLSVEALEELLAQKRVALGETPSREGRSGWLGSAGPASTGSVSRADSIDMSGTTASTSTAN